jgi:hypothetical protein
VAPSAARVHENAAAGVRAAADALDRGDGVRFLERLAAFGASLPLNR